MSDEKRPSRQSESVRVFLDRVTAAMGVEVAYDEQGPYYPVTRDLPPGTPIPHDLVWARPITPASTPSSKGSECSN